MVGREISEDIVLDAYYDALSHVVTYTREVERDMFRAYKKTSDPEIRRLLIESCLKLVFSLARRYWMDRDARTLQALISAGNVGLVEAVEKYDPERGARFSSYASFWILMYVRGELTCLKDVVMPSAKERKWRMRSAASRRKSGRPTTTNGSNYRSLDSMAEAELYAYGDGEVSETRMTRDIVNDDVEKIFSRWFRFLTVREQFVLRAYYGLLNGKALKLRQIAQYLDLSSERIRQIKVTALAKLRRWLAYDGVTQLSDVM